MPGPERAGGPARGNLSIHMFEECSVFGVARSKLHRSATVLAGIFWIQLLSKSPRILSDCCAEDHAWQLSCVVGLDGAPSHGALENVCTIKHVPQCNPCCQPLQAHLHRESGLSVLALLDPQWLLGRRSFPIARAIPSDNWTDLEYDWHRRRECRDRRSDDSALLWYESRKLRCWCNSSSTSAYLYSTPKSSTSSCYFGKPIGRPRKWLALQLANVGRCFACPPPSAPRWRCRGGGCHVGSETQGHELCSSRPRLHVLGWIL